MRHQNLAYYCRTGPKLCSTVVSFLPYPLLVGVTKSVSAPFPESHISYADAEHSTFTPLNTLLSHSVERGDGVVSPRRSRRGSTKVALRTGSAIYELTIPC
jgi:hypothetical protein